MEGTEAVFIRILARSALVAAVCASLLSGCASNTDTPALRSVAFQQAPAGQFYGEDLGKFVYTGQYYGEDLSVYRQKGLSLTFVRKLKQGVASPQGMMATLNGWWYVANGGHSNVLVYRTKTSGPVGPVSTLDDYGQFPSNVSVIPTRKLVAVSNFSTVGRGAGSVSIYLNRDAEPSRVLHYGTDPIEGAGVAIDHHANCYWAFNDPKTNSGAIVEFRRCKGHGTIVVPSIAKAGGMVFDQRDDLYYIDQTYGIYKCEGTSNCSQFSNGFGLPMNLNFDHKQKHLWVADASGYIDAVDPTSGKILYTIRAIGGSNDPPFGIAPAPGG